MTHSQPASAPHIPPHQVLVVDDSISVRKALERILQTQGIGVHTANSAEEALALLGQLPQPPTLMIADVLMPGLSGLELARAAQADHPALPLMLMSGVVDEALQTQAAAVGVTRLLRKPFTPAELLPLVFAVLDAADPAPGDRAEAPQAAGTPGTVSGGASPAQAALLARLGAERGVLGSGVFGAGGQPLSTHAAALPAQLGMYVQFLTTAATTAGVHLEARGLDLLQLDFGDRTLLLAPVAAGHLACWCTHGAAPRVRELLAPGA
ncbi:CheY-like chemotaxis protein [Deinococcus budaensis]|uniref:CheY-like chemotaxis protein n=1 Tax=Deinococcus budaensis TaxID=1665626 RepID=A0A7W8LQE8_9DEIO|nr:response regulator [Deinococcus budaensis]MBB5234783.1 CheY-like chemotaxis protein [Deinococcus budaensis]